MVAASSFSRITSTLMWNTTTPQGADYVDINTTDVDSSPNKGTQSNFTAQQFGPDNINDTLREGAFGTVPQPYYPSNFNPVNSTSLVSGTMDYLQSDNGQYMQFRSYASAYSGTTNFGQTTQSGTSNSQFSSIRGARYTCTTGGPANSITAYLGYSPSTGTFGTTRTGSSGETLMNTIRGQLFTTPSGNPVVAQSIAAYIYCSTNAKMMKAAIYDSSGNLVASTAEQQISTGTSTRTFTFASPPTLTASTQYILVVWSQSGSGSADLRYASGTGAGRYVSSQTYGDWPSSVTFSTNTRNYCIYCNYQNTAKAQCAIYSSNGGSRLGVTEEKTLTSTSGSWVAFDFATKPILAASTDYVLMAWSDDSSNVDFYYQSSGSAQYFRSSGTVTYPTWPSTVSDQGSQRQCCIYCTCSTPSEYTCEVEFIGTSNTQSWTQLVWITDSSCTAGGVNVTVQLWNYQAGRYALSGEDGYNSTTIGSTDVTMTQTITSNPADFRNNTGGWKLKFKAVTSAQFDMNIDLARYSPGVPNYALDLEEQWINVDYAYPRQDLCIKTGTLGSEKFGSGCSHGGILVLTVIELTGQLTRWNNVSVAQYIDSANFTIRFRGSNDTSDPVQDSWDIDAVLLKSPARHRCSLVISRTRQ